MIVELLLSFGVKQTFDYIRVLLKDFLLQDMVEVKVTEAMWNRTGGLCGLMDGHMTNDLEAEHDSIVSYANRWQANLPTGGCDTLSM